MTESFRRYEAEDGPRRDDGDPRCIVAHPDAGGPCGEPAVGEVWSMPFCEAHGREAELSAARSWPRPFGANRMP